MKTKLKPNKKSFPQDRGGTGVKNCGKVYKNRTRSFGLTGVAFGFCSVFELYLHKIK